MRQSFHGSDHGKERDSKVMAFHFSRSFLSFDLFSVCYWRRLAVRTPRTGLTEPSWPPGSNFCGSHTGNAWTCCVITPASSGCTRKSHSKVRIQHVSSLWTFEMIITIFWYGVSDKVQGVLMSCKCTFLGCPQHSSEC